MARGNDLYLAVDIGGTKILAALVDASGIVLRREKTETPREGGSEPLYKALEKTIAELLGKTAGLGLTDLTAMGVGVPGVVDSRRGYVIVTPNMGLSNTRLGAYCEKTFGLPTAIGNDCNVGILGEKWLGSVRRASSAMGILVGTGVGGGFIQGSRLWEGSRGVASEIGHIVMQIGGPTCGCGNRGCLEALASRTAIERDLREAAAAGRPTVLNELLGGNNEVIRSGVLRQALDAGDELVADVLRRAADVLGHACLTVDHLLDPEMIVFGGGVIDACSEFMIPIIEKVVAEDRLLAGQRPSPIRVSSLGDDAVILGATALARMRIGENPFKKRFATRPCYAPIDGRKSGTYRAGVKSFEADFFVTANGSAKAAKEERPSEATGEGPRRLTRHQLVRPCRGGPHRLFIGAGTSGKMELSDDARLYLDQRSIRWRMAPMKEAIEAYNRCKRRKAGLFYLGD